VRTGSSYVRGACLDINSLSRLWGNRHPCIHRSEKHLPSFLLLSNSHLPHDDIHRPHFLPVSPHTITSLPLSSLPVSSFPSDLSSSLPFTLTFFLLSRLPPRFLTPRLFMFIICARDSRFRIYGDSARYAKVMLSVTLLRVGDS